MQVGKQYPSSIIVANIDTSSPSQRLLCEAKLQSLWHGGGAVEPSDKDALLEERRRQRAVLREKRRKETNERMTAEKAKANEKDKGDFKGELISSRCVELL